MARKDGEPRVPGLLNWRYQPPSFKEGSPNQVVNGKELLGMFAISTTAGVAFLLTPEQHEWRDFIPSAGIIINITGIYGSRLIRSLRRAQQPPNPPQY